METLTAPDFRTRTVSDVVAEDYRRGAAFKRFGINFCCGGERTVEEACAKKKVAYGTLEEALLVASRGHDDLPDVRAWSAEELAAYIVATHHTYVRQNVPVLLAFTNKVARVHGQAHPELVQIEGLFRSMASDMLAHLEREEQEVFAAVPAFEAGAPADASVKAAVAAMEKEHERMAGVMANIRSLSNDYKPPVYACNTYRAAYAQLLDFEEDLHRHLHLENNILFPQLLS